MDGDRKYSQRGYMNDDRASRQNGNNNGHGERKPQGPRPPIDVTGPRLPRLVQNVTATRCFNCSTMMAAGSALPENCPKCGTALHCCKQCAHFEPATRFQCLKPIPVRIPVKDQKNDCPLFTPRVTVARDTTAPPARNVSADILATPPRNASDARNAFDRLFKK